MLEAAIWIGVVIGGVALLGTLELARSNSFLKSHAEEIKSGLPIVALFLLIVLTGSVAVFFFFLYFLASIWQFSLAVIFAVFVFPRSPHQEGSGPGGSRRSTWGRLR